METLEKMKKGRLILQEITWNYSIQQSYILREEVACIGYVYESSTRIKVIKTTVLFNGIII